ncbi:MAG TPA: HAD family hydrolase [Planctomycetaceae bacterium]
MPQTLAEYAAWLDGRGLLWPEVPPAVPVKATPYAKPLPGIRAVTFEVYGTLLRVTGGRLTLDGPDRLSVQIAVEKTVEEFNVWNSLFRKPGPPWQQVYEQYKKLLDERRMTAAVRKGDVPEVDAAADLWRKLIAQWDRKEFRYDEATLGDRDALAEKIAYFFHSRLQGVEPAPNAARTAAVLAEGGIRALLLSDGQCFTPVQLIRAFAADGVAAASLVDFSISVLSCREGVRKPSPSLYERGVERLRELGIGPDQTLHVGSRLKDDLAVAKRFGMRTALYAGDAASLEATKDEVRDPRLAPDRLLTDLAQLREVVGVG